MEATSGCPTAGDQVPASAHRAPNSGKLSMGECSLILRETYHKEEDESNDPSCPTIFKLRNASQMDLKDVGLPLFEYDRRKPKIEAYVPTEQDQRHLTKREQSWMLVEIPAIPDYSNYMPLLRSDHCERLRGRNMLKKEVMASSLPQDGLPNTLNLANGINVDRAMPLSTIRTTQTCASDSAYWCG